MAHEHDVPILVAHAHQDREGSWITHEADPDPMVGLAIDRTAVTLAPRSRQVVRADAALARANIAFDRVGEVLVVAAPDLARSTAALAADGVTEISVAEVARISLVGRDAARVTSAALANADAACRCALSTSPALVTVIVARPDADDMARALHAALLHSVRRYPLVA
jgi:aspartokinase